jgi:hypothetical protein
MCVFCLFVCFLSPVVWFFLWLPEEVLALLFLLHRENGDFFILMKDIGNDILQNISTSGGYCIPWKFFGH